MRYLLLLLLCLPLHLPAQIEEPTADEPLQLFPEEDEITLPTEQPAHRPVAMRAVPPQQWADASKGLDYSKDLPKPPKEEKPRRTYNPNFPDWTAATQGLGSFLQVLAILLASALIGYAIYRMLQVPRNRVIARDGVEITVDNIDQYIHETDLERFLREALAQGNYSLAIRLYYLQVIKDLSFKNAIHWSREKTNRDYQREMRQHRLAEAFRLVTLRFEEVWYGNQSLNAAAYNLLEPEFKRLLADIGGGG
ncbi:MAG: DUF4129 domain-containing protein [Saprospiraceae bacterium]